ncbi:Rne/Rng family ribonuclease [Heliobacterium chlorum]|uniref:Rne/Rng family ribonuclease n=1 Tax=Heliobacterium chlorum TaxID=2698 RepID=A0ABR7SZD3_HELCL|nr:Rne/Rng family ribonuclease [Heliobacterium chlorum]MBC9783890.1 Rne/Rng family ribonuclease [Heliobacterium chlorum]
MNKVVLVQVEESHTKIALLEDDHLAELHWEKNEQGSIVGNLYKGNVENVLPGMQAAFIDIGLERNAFLYVKEAIPTVLKEEGISPSIGDILKPGQEVLVQVLKEGIGTKGPRVTRNVTLPGHWVVLMPMMDHVGVSKRIEDERERRRLKEVAERVQIPGMGIIIRTTAVGADENELAADIRRLQERWQKIEEKIRRRPSRSLVYQGGTLVERILRDMIDDEVQQIRVNDCTTYNQMWEWAEENYPLLRSRLHLQDGRDYWTEFNLQVEIEKALRPKTWLKSGGYLVIQETEALTVIDVNTGKYTGTHDLEDTVRKTNLEAAREIARQLRLRSIGGIIVIDFIDMTVDSHRQEVLDVLRESLQRDKAPTNVLGITPLGLVEMTRKKVRDSLTSMLTEPCSCCDGRGRVYRKSPIT